MQFSLKHGFHGVRITILCVETPWVWIDQLTSGVTVSLTIKAIEFNGIMNLFIDKRSRSNRQIYFLNNKTQYSRVRK